jgi:hypothetical protein
MYMKRLDTLKSIGMSSFQLSFSFCCLSELQVEMGDSEGGGDREGFLAVSNGCLFLLYDVVDVFVGIASKERSNKLHLGGGLKVLE